MTPSIPKVQLGLPSKVLAQVCLGGFIKSVAFSSKRSNVQPAATEEANLTSLPAPSQSAVSEEHEATSLSEEALSTTTKDDGPNLGTDTKKRILKINEKRDHNDDDCSNINDRGSEVEGKILHDGGVKRLRHIEFSGCHNVSLIVRTQKSQDKGEVGRRVVGACSGPCDADKTAGGCLWRENRARGLGCL